MSVKELVLEKIREMPDDASPEEIHERVDFILGVRKAIGSMDAGRGVAKADVQQMVAKWAGR